MGLLYAIDRLLRAISDKAGLHVYRLFAQPVSTKDLLPAKLARNVNFAMVYPGDPLLRQMPARDDIKELRFARGASCLAAYRNDDPIGFIWWCHRDYQEDEVRCTYELADPERAVFDFDMYVFPKYRMGIGFLAVWQGANRYLSEQGIEVTCSRITRFNNASLRAHTRLGAKSIGTSIFLSLGQFEAMIATVPPYVGFTFVPGARIRLRIHSPDIDDASRHSPT